MVHNSLAQGTSDNSAESSGQCSKIINFCSTFAPKDLNKSGMGSKNFYFFIVGNPDVPLRVTDYINTCYFKENGKFFGSSSINVYVPV